MIFTDKDMNHLLNLAALEIKETEKNKYAQQLTDVLTYMDHLNELDLDNIEPTAYVQSLETPLREDEVVRHNVNLELNAPELSDKCFVVPQILED